MDEETIGLNIIFISLIGGILLFTYYAIPSAVLSNESDKKAKTHVVKIQNDHQAPSSDMDVENKNSSADQTGLTDAHPEEISSKTEETSKTDEPEPQPDVITVAPTSEVSDVIAMNNPQYKKHKKGIVTFTHEKHVTDYAISCGDCHHDEHGKPLELTKGDSVQNCIVCHKETQKPKGEKLDKKQKIAKYHFEAMHANCIGCHKPFNVDNGDPKGKGPAPTSCGACHPKNK